MASNPFAAPKSEAQLAHSRNRGTALRKPIRVEPEIGDGVSAVADQPSAPPNAERHQPGAASVPALAEEHAPWPS
jgi:hypothetical protein